MSRIEDSIREKLVQAGSLYDVDQDQLWKSIEKSDVVGSSIKKKRLIAFLLLSFITVGITSYFLISGDKPITLVQKESVEFTDEITKNPSNEKKIPKAENHYFSGLEELPHETNPVAYQEDHSLPSTTSNLSSKKLYSEESVATHNRHNQHTDSTHDITSKVSHESLANVRLKKDLIIEEETKNSLIDVAVIHKKEENIAHILPREMMLISKRHEVKLEPVALAKKKFKKGEYTIYYGPNFTRNRFSHSALPEGYIKELNSSFSYSAGYTIGVSSKIVEKKKSKITVGVEYHQFYSRFDKTFLKDTVITGGVNNELEYNGLYFRTIKHHNKQEVISVPLEMSLTGTKNRFSYSFGLGVSYSIVVKEDARLFNSSNELISYSGDNRQVKNYLSFRSIPSVSYALNSHVHLSLRCGLNYQMMRSTERLGLDQSVFQIIPAIGLTFSR